ncbi:MAG: DUF177 domain-containing protein [Candidatus Gastranaerophilales bacterium]
MYQIKIDSLENTEHKLMNIKFEEFIKDINSTVPIKADLTVKSLGDFIEITGNVKSIVKLECDLCLKEFEQEINFEINELFAKNTLLDEYGQETELREGQFITDLNGENEIDIYDFLYQSIVINLPNKKVCGINCNRDMFQKEETITDPRLDVFKTIKIEEK